MQWNNAAEFFAMGGYAFYVWGSFGACALLMIAETWLVQLRQREAITSVRRLKRADELDEKSL